ncbi:MAG TPA: hypothetical protein VL201_05525 [Patescibacteria group bacterium]|jgi:hypothetical protein|nr:hypothetical protein [Patescibacteria group bacterium]
MLILLCIIGVSWSYASELQSLPENNKQTDLFKETKKAYYENPTNGFYNSQTKMISFYDPVKDEIVSFQQKRNINTLFNEHNISLLDMLSSEKMNQFIDENSLNKQSFRELIFFIKQIDDWYKYGRIPFNKWEAPLIYTLNHFLYTITLPANLYHQNDVYNHFFICLQTEAANLYNDITRERKEYFVLGNLAGLVVGATFGMFYPMYNHILLVGAIGIPVTSLSGTITMNLLNYIGYKKFLKNIQKFNKKEQVFA